MDEQQVEIREQIAHHLISDDVKAAHALAHELSPTCDVDPEYYYLQAKLYESDGKLPEAEKHYSEAIRLNPEYSPPFGALLRLYRIQMKAYPWFSSTEQFYLEHPNDEDVAMEYALALAQIGKRHRASTVIQAVLDSETMPKLGVRLLAEQLNVTATNRRYNYVNSLPLTVHSSELPLEVSLTIAQLVRRRKYDKVLTLSRNLLDEGYRSANLLLWMAEALYFSRMYAEAEECLKLLPADILSSKLGQYELIRCVLDLQQGKILRGVLLWISSVWRTFMWGMVRAVWAIRTCFYRHKSTS